MPLFKRRSDSFRRSVLVALAASLLITSAQAGKPQLDRSVSGAIGVEQGAAKRDGQSTYIIVLSDAAVAHYDGGAGQLAATSNGANGTKKLDARSAQSQAYVAHLRARQDAFLDALHGATRVETQLKYRYFYAINGVALRLTAQQAKMAAQLDGVIRVERDIAHALDTDRGPALIGAPAVWNGSATGVAAQGEGMVVGIMDTGINQGHPSFAEVGDDGYGSSGEYAATNPFGPGGFAGGARDDCSNAAFPGLCNNKLIGSHAFIDQWGGVDQFAPPGDPVSKDTDGHGSHVASTAAGNVIDNAPLLDADGVDSGLTVGTVSGVAPHAHVIAYKVCAPSCFPSDIAAAIDQAILDGADALNHSIGAAGGSPWNDSKSLAFKGARAAGIMLHSSAGNSGPGAGTAASINASPWVTSIAASTHDRAFAPKILGNMSGGATTPPSDITGAGVTEAYSGTIVYAGDYPVGSPGEPNFDEPEQCLEPFPPGTFSGEIVLCDRGAIARVQKGRNVRDGGAGGLILANLQGGASSTNDDVHVIPAIHVNADNGDILRAWLATGTGHAGDISASGAPISDPDAADIMAGFSSRGPYTNFDFLAPHVSAPGSSIYAAGSDLQFVHQGTGNDAPSVPAQWGIISGTSMASPHATGSATLVKQLHPGWTAAEVKSALMTTGTDAMRKEDGVTPADPFDIGGGRVRVDQAAAAGLLLDETIANFDAADPALGGDPSTLNLPDLVSTTCTLSCSWQRTVRNVSGATMSWQVSTTTDSGMVLTANPASFTLDDGQTQTIEVSADTTLGVLNGWNFGQVIFSTNLPRGTAQVPDQHLTVAALFSGSSNANALLKSVDADTASVGQTLDYQIDLTNLSLTETGPFTISDTLPANVTYVADSANVAITAGADITPVSFDPGTGTVNWEGTLDSGLVQVASDPAGSPFGYFSLASIDVDPEPCSTVCDDTFIVVNDLPPFTYAGNTYTDLVIGSNGYVVAGTDTDGAFSNGGQNMPDPTAPNTVLAPFWTDLDLDGTNPDDSGAGRIYQGIFNSGTLIVVEWEDVEVWNVPGPTYTFQLWIATDLSSNPGVWFVYHDLAALPPALSIGAESDGGVLGDTWYFDGTGTAPIIGDDGDLRVLSEAGGTATMTFQAIVAGADGDTVVNVGDSTGPDGNETAIAVTLVAVLDADGDGVEDFADNCLLTPNPSQCDSDGDNFGNDCDADFNDSGFTNFADLALLKVGFFGDSAPPDYNELDLNCDSSVNMLDLQLFKALFGTAPGPTGID